MYVLKSLNEYPPGEYPYCQPGPIRKCWKGNGLSAEQQARQNVLPFRLGNNLSRATYAEVLQDIIEYTCARLGNDPRYCYSTDKSFNEVVSVAGVGCRTCLK